MDSICLGKVVDFYVESEKFPSPDPVPAPGLVHEAIGVMVSHRHYKRDGGIPE